MPSYKFQYFAGRYYGETPRLIFHFSGQDFEDEKITKEQWEKLKPTTVYGTLPILTIDGKTQIGQSFAIFHFLAKKFNLAGKDDVEIAKIEEIGEYQREFMQKTLDYFCFDFYKQEGDRDQKQKELLEPVVRQYYPVLVKHLKASKSEFFADSGVTWVDFLISEYFDSLNNQAPHLLKDYPELAKHSKAVHSLPQIQDYLSKRTWLPW